MNFNCFNFYLKVKPLSRIRILFVFLLFIDQICALEPGRQRWDSDSLSSILQKEILPQYRIPFSSQPTYYDKLTQEWKRVLDPFFGYGFNSYQSYIQKVESKAI